MVAAAPVTVSQQNVAAFAPTQEALAKLYDELSPAVVNIQITINIVPALIKDGAYHYAYLGIAGSTITAQVAQEHKLDNNVLGVYVGNVNQSGPAGNAGLKTDDIITAVDEQPIHRFEDLLSYLFNDTAPLRSRWHCTSCATVKR